MFCLGKRGVYEQKLMKPSQAISSCFSSRRFRWVAVAAALSALPVLAQAQASKAAATGDEHPDRVNVNLFGGGSFFQSVPGGLGSQLANGGAVGARVTGNFWRYVGIEPAFTYSVNNMKFQSRVGTPPGVGPFSYGTRLNQYTLNLLGYFTPRGSRFRPFVTVGGGAADFRPTDEAIENARLPINTIYGAQGLKNSLLPALNYGGGIKFKINDRIGLRADVRGLMSKAPTFGLPDYNTGGVYIPDGQKQYGVQTTAGIEFNFGPKYVPPPPPPPPAPKKIEALGNLNGGGITVTAGQYGPSGILCQGRAITLHSNASDPAGRPLTYRWKVNGNPAGGNSADLQFTPDRPGNYVVEVEVSAPNVEDHPVRVAKGGPMTINVQEYRAPTVTGCVANPSSAKYGDSVNFNSTGAGSPCSSIKYLWTITEGTISPADGPRTTLDTKTLRFDQSGKIQSKTVTATATVTDDRGASAKCTADATVTYTPPAIRFGDLIFGKGSSRVNNCAKRILLEEVATRAADQDYEIVLIGHVDNDEVPKGKAKLVLDQHRVKNAAAVLSGGTGTCAKVDASRIKVDWVGTEQVADKQPGLCGTSARVATKERKGSVVSDADQNRRVEVWLVPKGTAKPAGFKTEQTLDPKEMKRLGCPK